MHPAEYSKTNTSIKGGFICTSNFQGAVEEKYYAKPPAMLSTQVWLHTYEYMRLTSSFELHSVEYQAQSEPNVYPLSWEDLTFGVTVVLQGYQTKTSRWKDTITVNPQCKCFSGGVGWDILTDIGKISTLFNCQPRLLGKYVKKYSCTEKVYCSNRTLTDL